MAKMDSLLLRSKFRGSMLGALMGDCLGYPYEGEESLTTGSKMVLQKSIDKLEGPHFKAPVTQFSDDSAMALALANSLIERKGLDQTDLAKKFVKSYYQEPNRGYGPAVSAVFRKLRSSKFADVLAPAREQFDGQGSMGNGGAMRVSPVALFFYNSYNRVVETAKQQAEITHTHKIGVDGAVLQAIAVHQSLVLNPADQLDVLKFTDNLMEKMEKIEVDEEGLGLVDAQPYKKQLNLMRTLLCEQGDGPHDEKVVHKLGTDVLALHSVPTAIFCFLRAQKAIKHIETDNPLRRTIQYAVSLPIAQNEMNWCSDARFQNRQKLCQASKWTDGDIYKLVCLYRQFPCLWKKDLAAYCDNITRHNAYSKIKKSLRMPQITFTEVMIKIREIRRMYVRELKEAQAAEACGLFYEPRSTWLCALHEFLYPYLDYEEAAELHNIAGASDLDFYEEDCSESNMIYELPPRCEESTIQRYPPKINYWPTPKEPCALVNHEWCYPAPQLSSTTCTSPKIKYFQPEKFEVDLRSHTYLTDTGCCPTKPITYPHGKSTMDSGASCMSPPMSLSSIKIECAKRSDYTCTPPKNVAECGVQLKKISMECSKKPSMPACHTTTSMERYDCDSPCTTVSEDCDEFEIFSKSVACQLRKMRPESAMEAQNLIQKVITEQRIHKRVAQQVQQPIRLLTPEVQTTRRVVRKTHTGGHAHERSRIIRKVSSPKTHRVVRKVVNKHASPGPSTSHEPTKSGTRTVRVVTQITLGGDTDTIGSMAGAIAGAFYGDDKISSALLEHVEASKEVRLLADKLYDTVHE